MYIYIYTHIYLCIYIYIYTCIYISKRRSSERRGVLGHVPFALTRDNPSSIDCYGVTRCSLNCIAVLHVDYALEFKHPVDKPWDMVSATRRSSGVTPRACVRVYARVLVPPNLYIHTYIGRVERGS